MHHGLAVGANLEVTLDAIAACNGGCEGAGGILDHARGGIVQAAMRDRSRGKPIEGGHGLRYFRRRLILSENRFPFFGIMRPKLRTFPRPRPRHWRAKRIRQSWSGHGGLVRRTPRP